LKAAFTMRPARSAVGGSGIGAGCRGRRAAWAGLEAIQPQRTAFEKAPLKMAWTTRMLLAASGVH